MSLDRSDTESGVPVTPDLAPPIPGTARLAAPAGGAALLVAGPPRADLMPPEVRLRRSQLRTRRLLRIALVGVVVAVGLASAGSFGWSAITQAALDSARQQHQALVQQQTKYAQINALTKDIALVEAGQRVGASTEIDWQSYLSQLAAVLPAGLSISTVDVESASPVQPTASTPSALQGSYIATLNMTVTGPALPPVPTLLDSLQTLPGYVDAVPGQVALVDNKGYTVTITMHIDQKAYDGRFAHTGTTGGSK